MEVPAPETLETRKAAQIGAAFTSNYLWLSPPGSGVDSVARKPIREQSVKLALRDSTGMALEDAIA